MSRVAPHYRILYEDRELYDVENGKGDAAATAGWWTLRLSDFKRDGPAHVENDAPRD